MEEGQIVRLERHVDGAPLTAGDVGFVVSVMTPSEACTAGISKDVQERLLSYGAESPIAYLMILDEHGFIQRAGIVPVSALKEESGEEHKDAKFKYDKRLLAAETEQGRAYDSMCQSVAAALKIEAELVDAVIQAWDAREREQVSKLRA